MHIAIVLYDGYDQLDAIGPYEVFSHAASSGADIDVGLYTLEEQAIVRSSHDLRVQPDGTLDELETTPDLVVVPGGGWSSRAEVGTWGEAERGDIPRALTQFYDAGAEIATVCTGGMLAARAGLTDGRPAITHHNAIEDLRDSGAEVIDARVVDDGDLITAGGVTSGIDLALHLVERAFGVDIAEEVATIMEYERTGEVHVA
ncbi:MAG: DJ-1/PfpI family protein [Halobacteriales archaeon]|nr:DJ-1/PfpI family protein [Halobacteriales archaeon]